MRNAVILLVVLAGCDSLPPPPPSVDRAEPSKAPTRPSAPAQPPAADATVVSVEIAGRVVVQASDGGAPAGRTLVALTDGPCFQPGTHYFALTAPDAAGAFKVRAFPPRGTRLEVCAAIVDPARFRRTHYWTRSERGPIVAGAPGDGRYAGVDVKLGWAPVEVTVPEGVPLP